MKGMTLIVKNITIWVKILIFMFGIYVTLFGHLTPGGGFAGGVILASSYVLLVMAYGREFAEENLSLKAVSKLDCVGALMFAAVALFGLCYGATSFFYNFIHQEWFAGQEHRAFELISAGTIPLSNISIGLKVGASLFMVFLVLATFRLNMANPQEKIEE